MTTKISASKILMAALVLSVSTMGCNGNGGNQTQSANTTVTPENFVAALVSLANSGAIAAGFANTTVQKEASALSPGYFVIYNGATKQYDSLNLSQLQLLATENNNGNVLGISGAAQQFGITDLQGAQFTTNAGPIAQFDGLVATGKNDVTGQPIYQYSHTSTSSASSSINSTSSSSTGNSSTLSSTSNGTTTTTYTQLFDNGTDTKDASLQLSEAQAKDLVETATTLSRGLLMSFPSALQIVTMGEQMKRMGPARAHLKADDEAVYGMISVLGGGSKDQVKHAIAQGMIGNDRPLHDLSKGIAVQANMPDADLPLRIMSEVSGVTFN